MHAFFNPVLVSLLLLSIIVLPASFLYQLPCETVFPLSFVRIEKLLLGWERSESRCLFHSFFHICLSFKCSRARWRDRFAHAQIHRLNRLTWPRGEDESVTWSVSVVSMIHQEPQNSGLTSRLTTLQEDMGKSPARKRWVVSAPLSAVKRGLSEVIV